MDIMKGAWGDKLVDREVQGVGADNLTPKDIMGRIILMASKRYSHKVS